MTLRTSINLGTQAMRRWVFLALRATALPFMLREVAQRKKVTIIVYHAPSAESFDTHIRLLKHMYRIVPLSAYLAARQRKDFSALPSKALIITLDDGYRSNYALKDIIEKHDIPVTIFLCSGLINTRRKFWFCHEATRASVQQLKTVSDEERLAILRQAGFEETQEFGDRQALIAGEITELKHKVDFQSHTMFHPILPRCSSQKVEEELVQSKRDLQAQLGQEVYAFAYPNGDYCERDVRLVEKAGYQCALTLERGSNTASTHL